MAAPLIFVASLLAVLLSAVAPRALASEVVALPSEVESVVSGGRWQTARAEGAFRVVVRTGGLEHVVSQVQVDWVAMPSEIEEQRVVASKVAQTGSWRVLQTRVVRRGASWYALLEAMETHFSPAVRGTWEIKLGAPGELAAELRRK
jgi:hypothetical protein